MVAPDGSTLIFDSATDEVRRFDGEGHFLNRIGGPGEGPGEFRSAGSLGMLPGDTVWIRNLSPPYFAFFQPDGTFLRQQAVDFERIGWTGMPLAPEALLSGGSSLWIEVPELGGPDTTTMVPIVIRSPEEEEGDADTIASRRLPSGVRIPGVGTRSLGPDRAPPFHDVIPDGSEVIVADWGPSAGVDSATVVLRRFDADGELARSGTVRFAPVPIPPGTADSIYSAAEDSIRALVTRTQELLPRNPPEVPPDLGQVIRSGLDLEGQFAPIRGLMVGSDHSVWLARTLGASRTEWIALDETGDPLVRVTVPEGESLRAATRSGIWTTHTDEFDVRYVTHYRVEREVR